MTDCAHPHMERQGELNVCPDCGHSVRPATTSLSRLEEARALLEAKGIKREDGQ